VLAVVLAGAFAVISMRGSDGGIADGPLLSAPAGPDTLPGGRIIREPPRNCGVSHRTASRLVPGADRDAEKGNVFRRGGPGSCQWYSLDDGKATCDFCVGDFKNERVLNVEITLGKGRGDEAVGAAMGLFDMAEVTQGPSPPKTIEGLGEESFARYGADGETGGAIVKFRPGNAVVTVRYQGWDADGDRRETIPEKTAVDGALAAAAETARSLGAAADPVVTAVKHPGTPPLQRVPKPCDTVPAATVDRVARGAYRKRGNAFLLPTMGLTGASASSCTWEARTSRYLDEGRSRTLTVSLVVMRQRQAGMAVYAATRQHEAVHRKLRRGGSPGFDDFADLTPLTGPGDRAFAVTKSGPGSDDLVGIVLFQKRNVLVEVAYQGTDEGRPLPAKTLVDSAYTVAVAAERSLR